MKTIDISSRLVKIAERVKFRTLADVGTDHALLPVYLFERGRLDFAVASDINKGPLSRAKENINAHGLGGKISIRLGGGLSAIAAGEAETLVIAGMGGMLAIDILSCADAKSFKQIIVQPQHNIPEVRKFLLSSGFVIDGEEMLIDGGKFYNILDCSAGESGPYSEVEMLFGKALIEGKDGVLKAYICEEIGKTEKIVNGLERNSDSGSIRERINELNHYKEICGEVLACL